MSSDAGGADLFEYIQVHDAPKEFADYIPKRKPFAGTFPHLTPEENMAITDEICGKFFPEFVGHSSIEMERRPIPQMVDTGPLTSLIDIYVKHAPMLYRMLKSNLIPAPTTFNKKSSLGYPVFEQDDNKVARVLPFFRDILNGDLSLLDGAFVTANDRKQNERGSKKREFLFLNDKGKVYSDEVDGAKRIPQGTRFKERVASRTRLVFNYPILNLFNQVLDNALHKALMRFPMFKTDMSQFARKHDTERASLALDVSHMERITGMIAPLRATFVGGRYADYSHRLLNLPFLVPSDYKRKPYFVSRDPNAPKNVIWQLGSGISSVSPIQKELMATLYIEYYSTAKKVAPEVAMHTLFTHGDPNLVIWNTGDDNRLKGDETTIRDCFRFLQSVGLPVEEEVPPVYLGWLYSEAEGWVLRAQSYVLKNCNPEHKPGSIHRPFWRFGLLQKRKDYAAQGEQRIGQEIIPFEQEVWDKYGVTETYLLQGAQEDEANMSEMEKDLRILEGKDYHLSDQEKLSDPKNWDALPIDYTRPIQAHLLGD
jgi:hypothetical protein